MGRLIAILLLALGMAATPVPTSAHPLAPALIELTELGDGEFGVKWRQSIFKLAGVAEKRPILPAHCDALTPAAIVEADNSLTARWTIDCGTLGVIDQLVGVEGLADTRSDALVRIVMIDGRTVRGVVDGDDPMMTIPERESSWAIGASYANLGFEHIISGVDHLLFVFGLLLLVTTVRQLFATITAFTVGHSITLSFAMLGLAKVPSGPVEVLIAFSVFVLAVELAGNKPAGETLLGRNPWLMAGLFGLLHGLGFAGALREVGLPEHEIPVSLFSFNVGIEIGQLAFVALVLVGRRVLASPIALAPAWLRPVPVYIMGSLAGLWMIERSVDLLR
jgi:hydrogenase/urease accessory protein HupE